MKLARLAYRNFKARSFETMPNGEDLQIFGANGSGKTSTADAYYWLLFGKDSFGRSPGRKGFQIKDTRVTGEALNGVEHEVEAEFLIDGKTVTLKKVYKEVWTKSRGSATAEAKGNTVDYYWNGVGLGEREYESKLSAVCPLVTFRLLTDVNAFNTLLTWEERRRILLEVCGDVSDDDVIASNKKLAGLKEILGEHTLEEFRKIAAAKKPKINEELKGIPLRIDEQNRSVPAQSAASEPSDLSELRERLNTLREERATLSAGGAVAEKTKELRECEAEIQQTLNRVNAGQGEAIAAKADELRKKQSELRTVAETLARILQDFDSATARIKRLDDRREELLGEHAAASAKTFSFEQTETCPSCGQALPADKLEAARAEAEAQFNLKKSEALERILSEGQGLKPDKEREAAENEARIVQIKEGTVEGEKLKAEVETLRAEVQALESSRPDPLADPDYVAAMDRKRIIESSIAGLRESGAEAIAAKDSEIQVAVSALESAERAKALAAQAKAAESRVTELKARETELAAQYEEIEKQIFLTEEFVRTKVSMLTQKINGFFQVARFNLFELQVNGALVECCETTVDGVPYSGNLNHAAKVNVGIDIVNTLARHYGFAPPVFVDQCESVTDVMPSEGQQIRLVVSAADKTLRAETAAPAKTTARKAGA